MNRYEVIDINWDNLKSVKKAERRKMLLENKGYTLLSSLINRLTYIKYNKPNKESFKKI